MVRQVSFEGRVHTFPDDATDQEIAAALDSASGNSRAPRMQPKPETGKEDIGVVEDVARSFVSAVPRGVASIIAMPRDINDLSANWAEQNRVFGDSDVGVGARRVLFGTPGTQDTPSIPWISSQEIEDRVLTPTIGEPYRPQTTAGEYARTVGEFAPSALLPWARGARISRTLVPAAASETAGQLTEGQPYEGLARFAGGFAGGVLSEGALANRGAQFRRVGQPAPEAQALEGEFGPLTRGERSGNTRERLQEDDLRRGKGPAVGLRRPGPVGERIEHPVAPDDDRVALRVERGEGEAFRGKTALADALGGLAAARLAEGAVEQALARSDIGSGLGADLDHVESLPVIPAVRAGNQRVVWSPGTGRGRLECDERASARQMT